MTDTAVTRLAHALNADSAGLVVLDLADAKALLQLLADYCENDPDTDHTQCCGCGDILCTSCGLGADEARCLDDTPGRHCHACWHTCPTCSREAYDDARAEAYADTIGGRY